MAAVWATLQLYGERRAWAPGTEPASKRGSDVVMCNHRDRLSVIFVKRQCRLLTFQNERTVRKPKRRQGRHGRYFFRRAENRTFRGDVDGQHIAVPQCVHIDPIHLRRAADVLEPVPWWNIKDIGAANALKIAAPKRCLDDSLGIDYRQARADMGKSDRSDDGVILS
jgi:hypothetical protein